MIFYHFLKVFITFFIKKLFFKPPFNPFRGKFFICMKQKLSAIYRFSRLLITILQSALKNSRWRIQYGSQFWLNSMFSFHGLKWIAQKANTRSIQTANYNSEVRIEKFKMANLMWRLLYTANNFFSIPFTLFIYAQISCWFRVQEYKIKHYRSIMMTLLFFSNENDLFSFPDLLRCSP